MGALTRTLVVVIASLAVSGCLKNAVVFATATRTGIEISPTNEGQPGVHVGYRRAEGVTMPTTNEKGETLKKAYPVMSAYAMGTGGLWPPQRITRTIVKQVFASGRAATQTNSSKAVLNAFTESVAVPPTGETGASAGAMRELLEAAPSSAKREQIAGAIVAALAKPGASFASLPAAADHLIDEAMDDNREADLKRALAAAQGVAQE